MKTVHLVIILTDLIIITIGLFFLYGERLFPANEDSITYIDSSLLYSVFAEMRGYCDKLKVNENNPLCPVCASNMTYCNFVNPTDFNTGRDVCLMRMTEENYTLAIKRLLHYGGGYHTGLILFNFTLDKEWNIISQNMPEATCVKETDF